MLVLASGDSSNYFGRIGDSMECFILDILVISLSLDPESMD